MPANIPYTIFLGRPMPAPGEPMWLPEDHDLAIAWQRDHRARCGDCNMRGDDLIDPETGLRIKHPRWKVASHRCPWCEKAELHDQETRKEIGDDKRQLAGLKTVFVPSTD